MQNKIVLLVYLYSLDRLCDLDLLCETNHHFDISLVVSLEHKNNALVTNFLHKYKDRIIYYDEQINYGVDIAPFLKQLNLIDHKRYPYFIKLHSKQSKLGRLNHVDWGSILWDSLIGNPKLFNYNLNIIKQPNIGAITQPLLIYNNRELNNKQKISILCKHLNIDYSLLENSRFMAGSMFIGKTDIFQNILTTNKIQYIDTLLSTETGKVDDRNFENGTFCHSMERIFGYLVSSQNLRIHGSSLYPITKIYNKERRILHLHLTYNNIVYLVEDFNVCGQIISDNNNILNIEWYHLKNKIVKYKYLNNKQITKI